MIVEKIIPSHPLAPFVKHYLLISSAEGMANRVLPQTSLVMAFRLKGKVVQTKEVGKQELPASVITGLTRQARLLTYEPDAATLLVIFKETGAQTFIREPLHELSQYSVDLRDMQAFDDLPELEEKLANAANSRQQVDAVEAFLLQRMKRQKEDTLIRHALQAIHQANGVVRIKELLTQLYISQDAFEKRFRKSVGISPKQFSYIVKMQAVINNGLQKDSLAGLALDAGYFDQPHFNKDFKLFTGQSPKDFFQSPSLW